LEIFEGIITNANLEGSDFTLQALLGCLCYAGGKRVAKGVRLPERTQRKDYQQSNNGLHAITSSTFLALLARSVTESG